MGRVLFTLLLFTLLGTVAAGDAPLPLDHPEAEGLLAPSIKSPKKSLGVKKVQQGKKKPSNIAPVETKKAKGGTKGKKAKAPLQTPANKTEKKAAGKIKKK